jgi:hypothetical protein
LEKMPDLELEQICSYAAIQNRRLARQFHFLVEAAFEFTASGLVSDAGLAVFELSAFTSSACG